MQQQISESRDVELEYLMVIIIIIIILTCRVSWTRHALSSTRAATQRYNYSLLLL